MGLRGASEIVVPDPWMSASHATIQRRGAADVLCDEHSRNGTFVNGHPVHERPLEDGDLVEVGHSLFCYRLLPETSARALLARAAPIHLGPTTTRSPEMAEIVAAIEGLASSNESVLVLGETGTGKDIAARALHALSGRRGPLRTVHCGAVPESLFESTFFGHARGAFTGATGPHEGEIARSQGGTLFLDEVATMGASCQAKLLRVLEDGEVTKVGGTTSERFDVRWVAATNADLFSGATGFRSDLLRRLSSHVVRLPELRRRREDLGVLTAHVLGEKGIPRASITAPAARRFFCGTFPGNIRDLRCLRSAARLAGASPIELRHLPSKSRARRPWPAHRSRRGRRSQQADRRRRMRRR